MPARKGWIEAGAEYLFWAVSDMFPEFRHRLRYEVTAHNGHAHVYFVRVSPHAVMAQVNHGFFKRFSIAPLVWEAVVRVGGKWEPFESFSEEQRAKMTMLDFGWRHRESILAEPYPPFLVESRAKSETHPAPEMPRFLTKMMEEPGGAGTPLKKKVVGSEALSSSGTPAFLRKVMD